MANKCLQCGGIANFDKSPEGDMCGLCKDWVCQDCVDHSVCLKEYELPDGRTIAEDVICKRCSQELNLHNLSPVRIL